MNHRLRPAVAALTLVLAGALLSACGDKDDSKGDSNAGSSSTSSSSTKAGDLTKTSFFSSVTAAQLKAGSAHMAMSIGAAGQTIKADGDVKIGKSLADNAVSMSMDAGMAGVDTLKMVLVDGAFYMDFGKMTDGKYAKFDLKDKSNPLTKQLAPLLDQMDPSKAFKQYEDALSSFDKKGSPVEIDGVKAQPYQLALDTSKLAAFDSLPPEAAKSIPAKLTYVMYVGPDNLLRRVTYDIAGSKSEINYSKWGEPVDIKAPDPADVTDKDLSKLFSGANRSA